MEKSLQLEHFTEAMALLNSEFAKIAMVDVLIKTA